MTMQLYSTVPSRNLIKAELKMLKHAEPVQVLTSFGMQHAQPLKKTDTVVFRRLRPFNNTATEVPNINPANFITTEGVTPTANTISYTDVSTTLQQYAVLFRFSSKAQLMYEDDIPNDMAKLTGETLGEVAELVMYGQVRAGTNVIYTNGTTRDGVNTAITLNKLRLAARTLAANRAKPVTSVIKPGLEFGTSAVEPGYILFCHTDIIADLRGLSGFTKRVNYGSAITPVHPREVGAIEEFRIVTSPLLAPFLGVGNTTLNGMVSVGGTRTDVYPIIVMAEDAWGQVSLKGYGHSGISPTIIPANVKNHFNPAGMFGLVGADFWLASVRLNENWMVRIESCATAI